MISAMEKTQPTPEKTHTNPHQPTPFRRVEGIMEQGASTSVVDEHTKLWKRVLIFNTLHS